MVREVHPTVGARSGATISGGVAAPVTAGGRPDRGRSARPATPDSRKRRTHRSAVVRLTGASLPVGRPDAARTMRALRAMAGVVRGEDATRRRAFTWSAASRTGGVLTPRWYGLSDSVTPLWADVRRGSRAVRTCRRMVRDVATD